MINKQSVAPSAPSAPSESTALLAGLLGALSEAWNAARLAAQFEAESGEQLATMAAALSTVESKSEKMFDVLLELPYRTGALSDVLLEVQPKSAALAESLSAGAAVLGLKVAKASARVDRYDAISTALLGLREDIQLMDKGT